MLRTMIIKLVLAQVQLQILVQYLDLLLKHHSNCFKTDFREGGYGRLFVFFINYLMYCEILIKDYRYTKEDSLCLEIYY